MATCVPPPGCQLPVPPGPKFAGGQPCPCPCWGPPPGCTACSARSPSIAAWPRLASDPAAVPSAAPPCPPFPCCPWPCRPSWGPPGAPRTSGARCPSPRPPPRPSSWPSSSSSSAPRPMLFPPSSPPSAGGGSESSVIVADVADGRRRLVGPPPSEANSMYSGSWVPAGCRRRSCPYCCGTGPVAVGRSSALLEAAPEREESLRGHLPSRFVYRCRSR